MSTVSSKWRVIAMSTLIGMLAAGSASSQHVALAAPARDYLAGPSVATPVVASRRIGLPDGGQLTLSSDGRQLLWHGAKTQAARIFSLAGVRNGASLTLMPSGKVLVWGGENAQGVVVQDGWWFDPERQIVEPARNLPLSARFGHTATVLTDGRLLLVGGRQGGSGAELWDERTGAVTVLRMEEAASLRGNHQAQLLADGRVHLLGRAGAGAIHRAEWLFDPDTQRFVEHTTVSAPSPGRLALAGSLPAQDAREVHPDTRLAVRFTLPVRMSDLNIRAITLVGPGGATPIQVHPAESGRLVFIQPEQALFPNSYYTLMIHGVRARDGRAGPLMTLDFKTAVLSPEDVRDEASSADAIEHSFGGASVLQPPNLAVGCSGDGVGQLCKADSSLQGGIWTPGRDNRDGRWRIARPQPELMRTEIMAHVTRALGFTTLIGQIRRVDEVPVENVEVSIGGITTRTDANGHFTLFQVPAGRQEVYVDGSTADSKGIEYGQFVVGVDIKPGELTQLPYTMYLPRISERGKIRIASPVQHDMVAGHPDIPGLQLHIPKGTVIRDRKGRLVTELAIIPTPVNRTPFPVMDNHPMAFTLEPGGAQIRGLDATAKNGIRIYYPNYDAYPAGTQANFWIYDPRDGWRIYGKGSVSQDRRFVVPQNGVALHQTMGGMYSVDEQDPAPEEDKPECNDRCGSAQTGGGAVTGDPIDLATGRFFYDEADIVVPDLVPIQLRRSYRSFDVKNRSFGIATTHGYSYKLDATSADGYNTVKLVLPNGAPISFSRVSGSGLGGEWRQTGSITNYNNAKLTGATSAGFHIYLADGQVMHFGAFSPNLLEWMADRFGNRIDFTYDAGLLARITSPSGRFISLEYDAQNRIKTARDTVGSAWSYAYDVDSGLLTKVTYPDQTFKQYNYRYTHLQLPPCGGTIAQSTCDYFTKHFGWGNPLRHHAVKSIVDRRGIKILENEFEIIPQLPDYIGRVIKQILPDGSFYTINYTHLDGSTGGYGTLVTSPDGSQRRITFTQGQKYPKTDTLGYGTPLAQTVEFERNAFGQVTARIDSMSRRTEYQLNAAGQTTKITALAGTPDAISVSLTYNTDFQLTSSTDPLNRTTVLEYEHGCLVGVVNPLSKRTRMSCNAAGQPVSLTDPLNRTATLQYRESDLAEITDPLGRRVQFRSDVLGRLIATEDDQGNIVRREYDAEGRIKKVIDAAGEITEIAYNPNGNVTAVLLPHGNGITYDYDDQGNLLKRTDGLGQEELWTYDSMGRIETYTDRKSQVTAYDYDALGRLETTTYHDGTTSTAIYDAGNRLRTLADTATGTLGWDYDPLDRVIEAVTAQGSISYEYDDAGRRTAMSAASQPRLDYQYDDNNRLQRLLQGSEVVDFDYDDANRLIETILPNGVKTGYAYNDANQVTGIAWLKPDSTALGDLGYGYNNVGRLVAQTGSFASNVLPVASTGNSFDDNNRQTVYQSQALAYDANGNLTGDGTRIYVWNVRDQLTAIQQNGSTIASFTYDAVGRRVSRSEGGQSTAYLYDGVDAVQETSGSTIKPILTGLGTDERYAQGEYGNRHYFLSDALGSTRSLTDSTGTIVQRYDYDSYGGTHASTGIVNHFRYTGREQDANGLYYYRARYYHPGMGRFISEDSYGFAAGDSNFYTYALGNPVSYNDPSGHIVPLLVGGYALFELGMTLYDFYDTGRTLLNPCASGSQKALAAGLLLAGMVLPGGGYGQIDDLGRRIRNGHLAGNTHPKTGIPFDTNGFPDFSSVAQAEVTIAQTGSRAGDFRAANEAAGLTRTPEGYTWHHHQDGTTMQLVPTDIHAQTGHTGGFGR